ncbi:MAG: hypothetical protein AB1422_12690 [bacterium]
MKKIVSLVVFGIVWGMMWTSVAYADLTKQDIEEIRKIVREEIQREIVYVNQRIDNLETSLNKRIDDINKRIDDTNKRIDDLKDLLYVILAGMFALAGFVIWDRRTALAPAVKKAKELEEREERIEKALKEYAIQQPKLAAVLREVGIL